MSQYEKELKKVIENFDDKKLIRFLRNKINGLTGESIEIELRQPASLSLPIY